ncbi:MAG: toxin-antitoxin system HicB family antitoxin [Patescibacteria group bacterium]|nr:toxin-antitoxin system HicB family antitoxin [Patescibacteria group bacterium]
MVKITLRVSDELHRALTLAAHEQGRSTNNYLTRLIESALSIRPDKPLRAKPELRVR